MTTKPESYYVNPFDSVDKRLNDMQKTLYEKREWTTRIGAGDVRIFVVH